MLNLRKQPDGTGKKAYSFIPGQSVGHRRCKHGAPPIHSPCPLPPPTKYLRVLPTVHVEDEAQLPVQAVEASLPVHSSYVCLHGFWVHFPAPLFCRSRTVPYIVIVLSRTHGSLSDLYNCIFHQAAGGKHIFHPIHTALEQNATLCTLFETAEPTDRLSRNHRYTS